MAKLAFSKLGLKLQEEVKTLEWGEQVIEIKQYLPLEKKLEIIDLTCGNVKRIHEKVSKESPHNLYHYLNQLTYSEDFPLSSLHYQYQKKEFPQ